MVNSAFLNIVSSIVIATTHVIIYMKSLKLRSNPIVRTIRKNSKIQEMLYEEDANPLITYSGKIRNNFSVQ